MPEPVRIVRAEAVHVRMPLRRPLLDATGEYTHRRAWILRLVDERGRQGLGEAVLSPVAADVTTNGLASLVREVVPAIVAGSTPDERTLLAEGEPGRALLAALSGAYAGIAGSGAGGSVPVAATIGFGGPDAGAEAAAQAVELGFETLELRAGAERQTDKLVERLRAVRVAVGPEPRLRVDAGGAWDLDTATERLFAIEPYRIEFVEQPLASWDMAGHVALRERSRVPVALDEAIDSEGAAREALELRAADVLVVKPARVGGEAVVRRIAAAGSARGASIVVSTFFETGVGIAAALRLAAALGGTRAHGLATAGVLAHDLLSMPIVLDRGQMRIPDVVDLDEAELDARALERVEAAGD